MNSHSSPFRNFLVWPKAGIYYRRDRGIQLAIDVKLTHSVTVAKLPSDATGVRPNLRAPSLMSGECRI